MSELLKPLTLRQVYGLNPLLPPQDLTKETDSKSSFVYVSGNLTIIQRQDDQIILHGHTNDVSAFSVAMDKSLIVTGETSSIIIWDVNSLEPLQVYDTENYKPINLKFNKTSTKFASLEENSGKIRIYSVNSYAKLMEMEDAKTLRKCISHDKLMFSHEHEDYLLSFGNNSLCFFDLGSGSLSAVSKKLNLSDFGLHGEINDATFLNSIESKTGQSEITVATTMSNGHVVIWSGPSLAKMTYNRTIKLANESESLTTITLIQETNSIVIGSSTRKIRFYDENIKLKNWIANKQLVPNISGNITSISLMHEPNWSNENLAKNSQNKASQPKMAETTLEGKEFLTKHLLVTTTHGEVLRISHTGTTKTEEKSSVFSYGKSADNITCFVQHPNQSMLAIGLQESNTKTVNLELFDYENHGRVLRQNLSSLLEV